MDIKTINKLKKSMMISVFPEQEESLTDLEGVVNTMSDFRHKEMFVELYKYSNSTERYCRIEGEFLDSGTCGIHNCENYEPKNKISGVCANNTGSYLDTGVFFHFIVNEKKLFVRETKIVKPLVNKFYYSKENFEEWSFEDSVPIFPLMPKDLKKTGTTRKRWQQLVISRLENL